MYLSEVLKISRDENLLIIFAVDAGFGGEIR